MRLEESTGKIIQNATAEDVKSCIEQLGKDLDHCILSEGDFFIQSAASGSGLFVEYKDGQGHYRSDDQNLSAEIVKELFSGFLNGDSSYRQMVSFSLEDEGGVERPSGSNIGGEGSKVTNFEAKSVKGTVVDSVKREAQNSISYMIRRATRRFFRGLF